MEDEAPKIVSRQQLKLPLNQTLPVLEMPYEIHSKEHGNDFGMGNVFTYSAPAGVEAPGFEDAMSTIKPKNIKEAMLDASWIESMQDELNQFKRLDVCYLDEDATARLWISVVLQSIPCSPECKIVGQKLLDHPLSYALTATTDVPVVYLQQFWRIVSKVPDTEDTIKFMLDTEEFTYTVDMFRVTLYLPVETPENLFVAPVNIQTIKAFINMVGYQGVVDKVSAFYTKNLAQPWQTMFKVFNRCLTTRTSGHGQIKINILQLFLAVINRVNVDYAALLWWDFMNNVFQKKETIQNVLVRGMLIPDALLTKEIYATDDFKEYETVFVGVDVPMIIRIVPK
ncbi:hypothetical protein Tco_0622296 [Tanacetum coccineum]